MKKIIINIIIILFLLCIGFVAGVFVKHIPGITLNHNIGLADIVNFVVVVLIAIITPLVFNQWQDNKRFIKNFLIDEVKSVIKEAEKIKKIIDDCAINNKTNNIHRKSINMHFQCLNNKIDSLGQQIDISFKKPCNGLKEGLEKEYLKYWKKTTEGNLMSDSFIIDQNFCRMHNVIFAGFETNLKKAIHVINNL